MKESGLYTQNEVNKFWKKKGVINDDSFRKDSDLDTFDAKEEKTL